LQISIEGTRKLNQHAPRSRKIKQELASLFVGTLELDAQVALKAELANLASSKQSTIPKDSHDSNGSNDCALFEAGFRKATDLLTASARRMLTEHIAAEPPQTLIQSSSESKTELQGDSQAGSVSRQGRWALRLEPPEWDLIDTTSSHILSEINQLAAAAKRPAVVFDLDGTLVDVAFRTLGILKEWIASKASHMFSGPLVDHLRKVDLTHVGYSLADAFENVGIDLRDEQAAHLFEAAEKHWRKRFFDGKALVEFDRMIPGAVTFIQQLKESGIEIIYLTGRSALTMEQGTRRQLAQLGLPLENTQLHMKHSPHIDDHLFKEGVFAELSREFKIVGNFENEYLNLKTMMDIIPGPCLHAIVDSQHSARPVPANPQKVYRIRNFL
jgi:hypothetical protein